MISRRSSSEARVLSRTKSRLLDGTLTGGRCGHHASIGGNFPGSLHRCRLIAMDPLERISVDPAVRFGKACIRGTRISVSDVLGYLASGMTEEQILKDFPQVVRDKIKACLAYTAERERRTVNIPAH